MIPVDVKIEIKKLVKKYFKEELANFCTEIENLKQENQELKIEIQILKEGGNI
jgi:hypothetical protein